MTNFSFLLHLVGLPSDEDAFLSALSTCRLIGGDLDVLHVRSEPVVVGVGAGHLAGGAMSPEIYETLDEEISRRAEAAKDLYDRMAASEQEHAGRTGAAPIATSYASEKGNVADIVADRARFADLAVLTMPSADVDARIAEVSETVLFESGRPILFIPSGIQSITTENVAIGWDGSPHAVRAIFDAIPLLLTAKTVTVLTVAKDADDRQSPDLLRDMLQRHGIPSAHNAIAEAESDAGQILLDIGKAGGADLLVMGGYGKHPIREFIFGGATRTLLNNASIPIFMSH